MNIIRIAIGLVVSVFAFFVGFHFGREKITTITCIQDVYAAASAKNREIINQAKKLSLKIASGEISCDELRKQEEAEEKNKESHARPRNAPVTVSENLQMGRPRALLNVDSKEKSANNVCVDYSSRKKVVARKGDADVPETIFSYLHHPASPAKKAFFFTKDPFWKANQSSELVSKNKHVNKKLLNSERIQDSKCEEVYLTRTGSRGNQPNKCVAIVHILPGHESINQQSHRMGYTALNTDQYQQDYPRDHGKKHNSEALLLHPFLRDREKIINQLQSKLGPIIDPQTGQQRKIVVMVANEGVLDLLLNFMCSAEGTTLNLSNIVVFLGDSSYIALIESLGAHAIYHPSLGLMPAKAAGFYLDHTFSRMMWFKTTSVYLTLVAGYEVLFQDVDLVWLTNPFDYLESLDYDMIFMDDGARTPRYTPFFMNSGFYYVKNNNRTLYTFETFLKHAPSEIGQTHSHQSVFIRHIAESHHYFGLKVFVLDQILFPSGQAYHENKKLIKKIIEKTFKPYVFHMCWTDNRENKVVYFREIGMWYLNEQMDMCKSPQLMLGYVSENKDHQAVMNLCCRRELYWPKDKR